MTSPSAAAEPIPVSPVSLQRYAANPIHVQLAQEFRMRIASGTWAPGAKLPTEPQLADQLGINRGTLRRALAELIDDGLLVARRGRGTFVAAPTTGMTLAQRFMSLTEEFAAQGILANREVLSAKTGPLPERVAAAFGAVVPQQGEDHDGWSLTRVFRDEATPLALVKNYGLLADFPDITAIDFADASLFETFMNRYHMPIWGGERTFRAAAANDEVAAALQLPDGSPVLHLAQTTHTAGERVIEYSDVWINSELVAITSLLQR